MPIASGIPTHCVTHNLPFDSYRDALLHCYEDDGQHELKMDVPDGTVVASPDPEKITHVV